MPEILFGQSATAVGKTTAVTGDMTITGTTVEAASFTADLTQVTSDQSNRDRQFQGRIMDTANFPNATFKLTAPIELGSVPANGEQVTVKATGDLTLRGKTKSVTFDIIAQRNGDTIETNGTIPSIVRRLRHPRAELRPRRGRRHRRARVPHHLRANPPDPPPPSDFGVVYVRLGAHKRRQNRAGGPVRRGRGGGGRRRTGGPGCGRGGS